VGFVVLQLLKALVCVAKAKWSPAAKPIRCLNDRAKLSA